VFQKWSEELKTDLKKNKTWLEINGNPAFSFCRLCPCTNW
jgi:FPC/CPF motif-containing protein YcgG